MSDLTQRLAGLSPEKRRLLEARLQVARAGAAGPVLEARPRTGDVFPLSFAQRRLWLVEEMRPVAGSYNIPFPLRMRGPLDAGALERALNALRERHETLRTVFDVRGDEPVQVIRPHAPVALEVEDLSELPEEEREARAAAQLDADVNAGFDLRRGPLFRAKLLRLSEEEHLLLFTMHHIVSDGWSMGVLTRELGALYAAFAEGREPGLPPLPLQYADFSVWQHEYLKGEALERDLAFWRGALAGAPPTLDLPTDRPRPAVESHRGAVVDFAFPPSMADRVRALARAEGTTPFAVVLAGLRTVLGRWAGQEDVVVGTPVANRTRPQIEGLIGFFVNTLALHTDLSGDPTFRELVRREKETSLGAFQHQDLPFERLVEALKVERDLSRNPLFQVVFALQNAPMGALEMAGLQVTPEPFGFSGAKFDLTVQLFEAEGGGLRGTAEYAVDLWEEATVARLVDHWRLLLEEAASDPDRPLSAISMIAPVEEVQVTEEWSRREAPFPRETAVHRLFERQAAATPGAPAVEFGEETISYRALNERANRIARQLRAAGVREGDRVALSMERGPDLVPALLAVLKAGAAYVPLDPAYPAERLAFMAGDAGVSLLLVRGGVPEALAGLDVPVVSLERDAAEIAAREARDLGGALLHPESLAYVVYTSGSTGTPKGVAVPHRAVVRLVKGNDFTAYEADDVVPHLAPVAFDASTYEIWGPLLNGARVAVFPPETPSLEALARFLAERGVTRMFLTCGLFHQLAEAQPEAFAGLRQVMTGGDVVSLAAARRVMDANPALRLCNIYGPTENTTFSTVHPLERADLERPALPIGRPIVNSRAYVLDAAMRPCPVGVPGELYVGGEGLAWGYVDRPGLTAERFLPDPFSGEAGARLYRTGDRVRWLADGALEFMGRVDQQVKVRGHRIEPGEVESALCAHEAVGGALVMARSDRSGDKRLVAYVVPLGGRRPEPDALREHLRGRLPEYMLPSAVVALDAFPLTANGKVDRRALPDPDFSADAESYAAPRGAAEELLAGLWAEVLGVERVGATDDFFALGGHSLLATQVVSRVRGAFGVELPLRAVFEAPTVRALAARIEAARDDSADPLPPVERIDRGRDVPASFAQERLWFLDQLDPGNSVYNMPFVLDVEGRLDVPALEGALRDLAARHEALRTTFGEHGGEPVQRIADEPDVRLRTVSVEEVPEAERAAAVQRLVGEEARLPFDLARGPLFRALLVREGEERHVLVLDTHHVVSDGWSLGIVYRELSALYAARVRGEAAELPELPVQYADFAVWQRRHLRDERLQRQISYWREALAGAPTSLELPTDRPRPAQQSFRGDVLGFLLPEETVRRVEAFSRREGATPFMTLLAVWQVLLARYARQDDVVVGSPIAGRDRAETEGLVGFFVNTLALRADLSADPSFRELVAQVRETTLGAYAHQELPFERLVEELKLERSMSSSPVFQVMFALQNAPLAPPALEGLTLAPRAVDRGTSKFDLTLDLAPTGDGTMQGALEYAVDLFDRATVERMAEHFGVLVEEALAAPDRAVSHLPLMTPEERAQVVRGWNGETHRPEYRRDVLMHEWFEAQAERTPDRAAVRHEEGDLTYRELNERANRLAHWLRRRGVGPEVRVGVLMDRTPELIVALYGVLKAGGAYVPLDPAYPAERVQFMLEDTRVPVLLTQERHRERLPELSAEVLPLDARWDDVAGESAENPERTARPENLAYLIYTSGSTGRPKGVQLEHRGAAIVLQWMRDEFPDEMREAVLAATSVCFDVSIAEIFGTLAWGGTLLLVRNALSLAALPEGWAPAMASMVPSAAAELLRMGALPDSLRSLNLGGEPVQPQLARDLYAKTELEQVVNLYGPSEDTTYTTALWIPRGATRMTVGRPVANTQIHVVDRHLRPTPVGVPGELYIGGHGVTRGYHDRPALTAERYLPDPFSEEPGARMYRTGDLARYLPDGQIEYLGRLDHQVKIRGHRVEIGEIEETLASHPRVRDAAVTVREDAPGMARLVAYYVADGSAPGVPALRAHLKERLPEYMIPAAWVRLDELPHTPNGKVDRRRLPAPDQPETERAFVAPRTPTEQVLAGIWRDVLKVERVGARDDFWEMGGHSLLATQVMSRVREALQTELPLRALFEAPTVEELAARVDAARQEAEGASAAPMVPVARGGELALSFAQERLWFIERLQPGRAVYNMPMRIDLRGPLDAEALGRALDELARRHESLRTVFGRGSAGPVQVVREAAPVPLPVDDLTALDPHGRDEATARIAAEDATTPFDLEAGPLLRVRLVRRAETDHVLLLNMHHIVSDGWSMGVLFAELTALYEAFRDGRPSPLDEPGLQYADFAAWQRAWLSGETLERQVRYWRDKLGSAPTLDLPTDRPRPPVQSFRGSHAAFRLPRQLTADLEALARREGATLYMTLLAAFYTLLWRYGGQEDIVVGSPIAGRNRAETEGMIGFFVNTLGLRTDLSGDPGFRELLGRVRETTLDAYAHQDLPFEKLVEELKVERSLSRHPLFQVSFSLQNHPMEPPRIGGLDVRVAEGNSETTKFDLTLGMLAVDGEITGSIEYAVDLFDPGTINRLVKHFEVILQGVVAAPERRLSELPRLLDEGERHRVLVEWNRTERDVSREPVHRLFAAQAARTPEREAVVFGGHALSYAELDAAANRLARRLRALGVGPERRVGIFLDRSPATVTAILATLKAGGAYVPFDPAYPSDRLHEMMRAGGLTAMLTQQALRGSLPALEAETLVVDDPAEQARIAAEAPTDPGVEVDPEGLAYLIFTSGSTGTPKGVMVPHRGIPNLAAAQARLFDLDEGSRVLQFASVGFDAAVSELFATLLAGGTLVMQSRDRLMPGAGLEETLRERGVTAVTLPPSVLAAMHEDGLPSLRTVIAAGEACGSGVLSRWSAGRTFVNAYGPTESTVGAVIGGCEAGELRPPIGRPIDNVRVYVLDAEMHPVPIGVPGELYVGGMGLARGYAGRPGLTAEKFVPDPFADAAGARLYRTGDRVRHRRDGRLEFLGRVDEQVKIRGFRIEPGEVEAHLAALPGVRHALVTVRPDAAGSPRLVGYVAGGAEAPDPADLRAALRERLPDYMVPSALLVVESFPLTPNGKVDRDALPAPEEAAAGEGHAAPQSALERKIAAVWQELLGLKTVGVDDNFFDIGGHSLLLAQLHERLRETLERDVAMVDLFQYPTISALARHLDAQRRAAETAAEPRTDAREQGRGRGAARREMLRRRRR